MSSLTSILPPPWGPPYYLRLEVTLTKLPLGGRERSEGISFILYVYIWLNKEPSHLNALAFFLYQDLTNRQSSGRYKMEWNDQLIIFRSFFQILYGATRCICALIEKTVINQTYFKSHFKNLYKGVWSLKFYLYIKTNNQKICLLRVTELPAWHKST